MWRIFQPRLYVPSIYEVDLGHLAGAGYKGIILDLDNTLVPWNHAQAPRELLQWVERARGAGLQLCIVSNNLAERVERFATQLGVMHIARAGKPQRRAFTRAMGKMGTQVDNTVVIGDQVFTDIWGGNRLSLFTILVQPVDARELVWTRWMRHMERWVARRGLKDVVGG
ncbi:MAG: YqeG family HAD IIIA-type phosphatase [Firmicutes bacterium]|nr:YqeG family HAD IIIA-type phosphatase [Alicyclobacillaceae bacterium]MCL6496654.1 YqeG family HAD IIIA-type phosphatase [Bacillota bacterium]